jgi:hypothetical protein
LNALPLADFKILVREQWCLLHNDIREFDDIYADLDKCIACREKIPAVAALPKEDFKFHWRPYLRGPYPLGWVLLTWEPPSAEGSGAASYTQEGLVNVPLQFFIRTFLIPDSTSGFLITNMAKCSMKTGNICDETRNERFHICSSYLRREISIAKRNNTNLSIVSVGKKPEEFLNCNLDLRDEIVGNAPFYQIMHYSPQCNRYFHTFATGHAEQFESFCNTFRSRYEQFIQNGDNGTFRCHWAAYGQSPTGDMERLFKGNSENPRSASVDNQPAAKK